MNSVHFSSATDQWATPQEFFDAYALVYAFDVDVCALPSNAKCQHFFAPEEDGLSKSWGGG